tara:strand:- start:434 stop:661 length:228 start_codon:yes stop_codon:yes gene_type:complete
MDPEELSTLILELCEDVMEEASDPEVAFDLVKGSSTCDDCYEAFKANNPSLTPVQMQEEFYGVIKRTLEGLSSGS